MNRQNQASDIQRDIRLDVLKTLGLMCIIFAHVGPENNILFNIRRFDVPMMVIVSGILYFYSSGQKKVSFWNYLQKRLPRLIAPVWVFLIFFFVSASVIFFCLSQPYPFSTRKIFETFLLSNGIGYVWIIRVFTLVAIFAVLINNIYQWCQSEFRFLTLLSVSYLAYEILVNKIHRFYLHGLFHSLVNDYLFYLIPYGCLFGLGMTLPNIRKKTMLLISGIFCIIFFLCTFYYSYHAGHFVSNVDFKYPPKIYYISYGIFMSLLCFFVVDNLTKKYNFLSQKNLYIEAITFISSSSLWIYLWHIFFVYYWQKLIVTHLPNFSNRFVIDFFVVLICSISVTYLQKKLISQLINNTKFGQNNAEYLNILFLK